MGRIQTSLIQRGFKVIDEYIIAERKGDVDTRQHGADAMRQLCSLNSKPDGVFCFNDPLAMGAMKYLLDQGLRIPEDVAVTGCGNLHYEDELRVPLSSIDQNSRRIGEEAARIALSILNSKVPLTPESVVLHPELVVRIDAPPRCRLRLIELDRSFLRRRHSALEVS